MLRTLAISTMVGVTLAGRQLQEGTTVDSLLALGTIDAGLQDCRPEPEDITVDCALDPSQQRAAVTYTPPRGEGCDGYGDYISIYTMNDSHITSAFGIHQDDFGLVVPYQAEQTGETISGVFRVYVGHYEQEVTQRSGTGFSFVARCNLEAGVLEPEVVPDPGTEVRDDRTGIGIIPVYSDTFVNVRDPATGEETNVRRAMRNATSDRPGWIISFGTGTHPELALNVRHIVMVFPDGRIKVFLHNGEKRSNDLLKVAYPSGTRDAFVVMEQQAEAHIDPQATTVQFTVLITMSRPNERLGVGLNEVNPTEAQWLDNVGLADSSPQGRRLLQERSDFPKEVQFRATYPQLQLDGVNATPPSRASSAMPNSLMSGSVAATLLIGSLLK